MDGRTWVINLTAAADWWIILGTLNGPNRLWFDFTCCRPPPLHLLQVNQWQSVFKGWKECTVSLQFNFPVFSKQKDTDEEVKDHIRQNLHLREKVSAAATSRRRGRRRGHSVSLIPLSVTPPPHPSSRRTPQWGGSSTSTRTSPWGARGLRIPTGWWTESRGSPQRFSTWSRSVAESWWD